MSQSTLSALTFLQLAVILGACWLVGRVLRRFGQPQVIADMVAGFLLGAVMLVMAESGLLTALLPTGGGGAGPTGAADQPSIPAMYVIGQLGIVLFMFLIGMSLDLPILARHLRHSVVTSVSGVCVPVLFGGVLGYFLLANDGWFRPGLGRGQAVLFLGAAVAVTAFPVLARIIREAGLMNTRVGVLALACGAVDDAVAWLLLAIVVATGHGSVTAATVALGGTAGYLALMIFIVRPLAHRVALRNIDVGGEPRTTALAAVLIYLLLCAWITEQIGVHAVFGAFVAGAVMPRGHLSDQLRQRIEPLTISLLVPIFFVYAGLKADLEVLLSQNVLMTFLVVLAVSIISKGGACTVAARATGLGWTEAASIGALMNARGLMELVLINIGLEANIITEQLYTVLALMTLVTTLAASPLHNWIARHSRAEQPPQRQGAGCAVGALESPRTPSMTAPRVAPIPPPYSARDRR